jgi:hypothetical protein
MKYIKLLLAMFLTSSFLILGCTSLTENGEISITGRVFYKDSEIPAANAKVFLSRNSGYGMPTFSLHKSTYTNTQGCFQFKDLEDGFYELYAYKYGDFSQLSHISPLSESIYFISSEGPSIVEDVFLYKVFRESKITGNAIILETGLPADSANIILSRLDNGIYSVIDSVFSDSVGNFQFENVRTGTHHIYASAIDTAGESIDDSNTYFCNGKDTYTDTLFLTCLTVLKPAIYIYPEEDSQFQVQLISKNGTRITKSIPEYNSSWDVFVEKSSRIEKKYDYLFYESSIKVIPEFSSGWCIPQENLKVELNDLLLKIGLNQNETNEFLDYWLNRLQEYNYYKIYPIFNEQLDYYMKLKITPPPDTIFRVKFFFQGSRKFEELPPPQIKNFVREGTTVVEWGGVLLN